MTYKPADLCDGSSPGYLPLLRATNIVPHALELTHDLVYVRQDRVNHDQMLRLGDVLIAMSSGSKSVVGKAAQLQHEWAGSFGAFCAAFRVDQAAADMHFVGNVFRGHAYRAHVARFGKGTNIRNLSRGDILTFEFLLPSLAEQHVIAHVLRTVQRAADARRRELALEREWKAALMQNLFTHGTRREPLKQTQIGDIPESWPVMALGIVCQFLQYGTSKRCDADANGAPVLRIPNIIGGKIDDADLKFIKLPENEAASIRLQVGDLLFVRTNGRREYTGRCAVYAGEPENALFASYLIRARVDTNVAVPEFVQAYASTEKGQSFLGGRATNAADGKFNINTQTIRTTLIPLPSIAEQREIVQVIAACDAKIEALERETVLLYELFCAMLEELMSGRLSALPLVEDESAA